MHDKFFDRYIDFIRERLRKPLPGSSVQFAMAPRIRPQVNLEEGRRLNCRDAAVLIVLFPLAHVPTLILTVRPEHLPLHGGQISLPGGRQENGESLQRTALREAHEEVNLPDEETEILGALTPLYIPPSHYCVHPFVGVIHYPPSLRASEEEVADILQVSLLDLLDPANCKSEIWDLHGYRVPVPYFDVNGHKVWGATAMVLAEFLALFKNGPEFIPADKQIR